MRRRRKDLLLSGRVVECDGRAVFTLLSEEGSILIEDHGALLEGEGGIFWDAAQQDRARELGRGTLNR